MHVQKKSVLIMKKSLTSSFVRHFETNQRSLDLGGCRRWQAHLKGRQAVWKTFHFQYEEKRNFWCAHWKTDCIMEQVMWTVQSLWEIREQFLFRSWWLSEILFTNPNRNKTSGGQNRFLYVCIMGSLKTATLIPADQFNYFNMFCLYYVYMWCSLLTSAS